MRGLPAVPSLRRGILVLRLSSGIGEEVGGVGGGSRFLLGVGWEEEGIEGGEDGGILGVGHEHI